MSTTTMITTSEWFQWLLAKAQQHIWLILAITVIPGIRGWINAWRLQKRREKYPHMIKLEVQSKTNRHKWTLRRLTSLPSKKLKKCYQRYLLPTALGIASTFHYLCILPTVFIYTSLFAFVRAIVKTVVYMGKVTIASWRFIRQLCHQAHAKLFPPPKEATLQSVLRKPKAERLQEAEKANQPLQTNYVQFDIHSTGQVRTQQYYFNPHSEPGDRVPVEPSRTPPREIQKTNRPEQVVEDPEEIGRRLSERNKIKHRIQTPPPKSRQKKRFPPTMTTMAGKENDLMETTNHSRQAMVAAPLKFDKQSEMVPKKLQPHLNTTLSSENSLVTPRNAGTVKNGGSGGNRMTPRPFLYSSTTKEPLSAQVRKRRMAGETLFSHTPQELSKSLEPASGQKQPKRRRLLTILPNNRRRSHLPPSSRSSQANKNKRQREEEILKEFNRKRVKEPETPVATAATPSATATTAPPFAFGGAAGTTPAPKDGATTTPAADAKPGFTFGGANATATTPGATAAATPASTTTFQFGATPGTAPAAGQPPAATTGTPGAASDAKPGFQFGATPAAAPNAGQPATASDAKAAPSLGGTPAAAPGQPPVAPPAADAKAGFQFGAATPAAAAPNPPASGSAAAPAAGAPTFQFGGDKKDGAATTPGPIQFGGNATPAAAPGGFNFGSTNGAAPAAPATATPIQFGSNGTPAAPATTGFGSATPAAKPDPPATNANAGPKPSFAFGSTASNTPQPGASFGSSFPSTPAAAPGFGQSTNAGATPGAPAFGQTTAPPTFGQNTNAGAAPAFGQTNNAGATPGAPAFGQNPGAGVTPGGTPAFGQTNASAGATPGFGQTNNAGATPGAPGFGSAPGFGQAAPPQAHQFGAPPGGFQASQFATPSAGNTPGFGQAAPASGGAPGFGQAAPAPGFGQAAPAPGFGQAAPASGASARRRQKNRKKRI